MPLVAGGVFGNAIKLLTAFCICVCLLNSSLGIIVDLDAPSVNSLLSSLLTSNYSDRHAPIADQNCNVSARSRSNIGLGHGQLNAARHDVVILSPSTGRMKTYGANRAIGSTLGDTSKQAKKTSIKIRSDEYKSPDHRGTVRIDRRWRRQADESSRRVLRTREGWKVTNRVNRRTPDFSEQHIDEQFDISIDDENDLDLGADQRRRSEGVAVGGNGNGTGQRSHFAHLFSMIPREYKYTKPAARGHGNALGHNTTNASDNALVNKNNDIPKWWANMVENKLAVEESPTGANNFEHHRDDEHQTIVTSDDYKHVAHDVIRQSNIKARSIADSMKAAPMQSKASLTKFEQDYQMLNPLPKEMIPWEEPSVLLVNCWTQAMLAMHFTFSPACTVDGSYSPKQCYLQRCWCVNTAGRPTAANSFNRFYFLKDAINLVCPTVPVTSSVNIAPVSTKRPSYYIDDVILRSKRSPGH